MSDGRELTVRLVSAGDLLGGSDDEDDELEKLLRTCDDGLKELFRSACQDWGMSMDALSSLLGAFPSDEEVMSSGDHGRFILYTPRGRAKSVHFAGGYQESLIYCCNYKQNTFQKIILTTR